MPEDCIFCAIVGGQAPAEILDRDEHTVAFLDINPWARGHLLVVPRLHAKNLYEIEDEDLERTMLAARRLAARMRETLGCEDVMLLNCRSPSRSPVTGSSSRRSPAPRQPRTS